MNSGINIPGISTLFALLLVAASGNVGAGQTDVEPPKMKMTTEIPESIIIPNKTETRIGILEFFDGLPTEATVQKAYDFLDFQRAVDVFLDEMRAASMVALRNGHRDLGITKSNQIVIFENLMDSKSLWLTANTETVYASTFIDLKDGPIVVESPPNVLAILDDMWMRYVGDIGNAGPDRGKGGKFLILPPGYKGNVPEGYHVYHSKTYGVWFLLRGFLVDGNTAPAVANIKKHLHIFPLAKSSNPPVMEFKNASGIAHNTIHANDFHFFEELNSLIQEEHDDAINAEAKGRLALLGIVKGQPFNPDKRIRNILNEAALVGAGIARSMSFASRDEAIYFYPDDDRTWFNPFAIGNHEFMAGSWLHRDARSVFMYNAIGITPAMAIAMPGIGSQYAAAVRDANGDYLNGSKTYRLTLPPNVPAKDFWSIVLYDTQTRSMLQTDQQFPSLNSERGGVEQNADGSFDIYFGHKAPQGKENNWVQTVPGKGFLLILRLYGPLERWFDKTWRPGKIELMLKTPTEIAIPVTISQSDSFEDQVSAYIKNYPYQETYKYIQFYTGASVKGLSVWFWPPEPSLIKAGEDKVVRMNNDTFYNGIVLDLSEGPVVLGTEAANDRFYSFQLQDDRNVNYANIIQPEGEYTFYYGEKPENIVGKAVEAASELSIIIVRIEVKNKDDAQDVAAATKVYKSLTSSGEQPAEYPVVDVLSQFSEEVATEADKRITEKFMNSEVPDLVLNFGQKIGTDISYLAHAAAAKGVWGGPDLNHSMYDTLFNDVNGEQLDSRKGTYSVTTEVPNVNGFWSVTAYDTDRGGFLHPNKDDRYHFNEATAVANSDGTYTFTFKQECQTTDINCLEVPKGHFDVAARYYLPSEEIINREWIFPSLELQK